LWAAFSFFWQASAWADGKAVGPAVYQGHPYQGSVEEHAQEAILIFHDSEKPGEAREDLVLRITVQGEVSNFAWVVPFPNEPQVAKEDAKLFTELYDYVEARLASRFAEAPKAEGAKAAEEKPAAAPVEVLSRKIVGSFDVAVVRENQSGALNEWLKKEGYQTLRNADDVLGFYDKKKYVFACIKVSEAQLDKHTPVDLHPLRFSFKTGGRDGMFFPMKMTGLQDHAFDVNLYVYYHAWLNDHVSKFGYEHRGLRLKYRDWDTPACEPNAGKTWSTPQRDVFLRDLAPRIPTVAALFQKLHPGERYYLTNIQALGLKPEAVRQWSDDLWLFPYYVDRKFVPYDARPGGPGSAAWPDSIPGAEKTSSPVKASEGDIAVLAFSPGKRLWLVAIGVGLVVIVVFGVVQVLRRGQRTT
jgi:hypothetical protein